MDTGPEDPFPYFLFLLFESLSPAVGYLIYGVVIATLLLVSSLVSGSEVAFFSLSSEDINFCGQSEKAKDRRIFHLLQSPKLLLATILVLNNLVNIAIVTLSTFLMWQIVGSRTVDGPDVLILSLIVTFLIVFFGEIIPKVYANQRNLTFARTTSGMLSASRTLLLPLSKPLIALSNIVERRIEKKAYTISVDEMQHALELTTQEETTDEEKGILKGIVNFGTLSVKQVMRSRLDITAFDVEQDFHELMDMINKSGYSRIPVFRETIDKIEGVLYIKDLLPYLNRDEHFKWQNLLRPGYFVPESKKIDSLLQDFQDKRVHMAIVVDEYGGTSGVITMEDIIEEIVGEINDEFDEEEDIAYNKLDANTYVFEGKTTLNDFCKVIGEDVHLFEPVKGESESLGGLLLELNAKLPRAGEQIKFNKYVFTVVSVDPRRIKRVRVFIKPTETADKDVS